MLWAGSLSVLTHATKPKIPIGVQLWSVRKECEKDLPRVLEALAGMGYDGVEFAGYYDRSAKELRRLLDANGLKCCGTHIRLDALQGDELKKTVEFSKTIGNKYLIVAWMPEAYTKSLEACKDVARQYDKIAPVVKEDGMFVGYHAHGHDFNKIGDEHAWDLFFENTGQDVVMQLDIGNCIGGGGDPIATLKRFPGRSHSVHLRESGGPPTAVIGEGDVDWKQVFQVCETTGGTKWYIVEHSRSGGTPMENVQRCLQNLRKMGK